MIRHYEIANHALQAEFPSLVKEQDLALLEPFLIFEAPPDVTFKPHVIISPPAQIPHQIGARLITQRIAISLSNQKRWMIIQSRDDSVDLCRLFTTQQDLPDAIRAAMGVFLRHRLPKTNGIFIHASGVLIGSKAFLFLASSQTGKTTLSLRALGKGLSVLSDDQVFMTGSEKQFIAHSTPFGSINSGRIQAPIAGLFLLKQGERTEFVRLRSSEAIKRAWVDTLYNPAITTPSDLRLVFTQWFDLFSSVPCYEMQFPRDFDDWDKLLELTAHE